ncbi:putative CoA-substrate-specific enzyme activase [[Clostridium] cellulosi]|uniref:Putative CoA-substrate-specific enzyme activase n=1 Tax=[Clostridium] cellulosi TaxID=29343 RepID=A0A078KRW4_9FIRM|nr:putative CoA-substrate-specific enzyme activase [[Clostridium] cellulosi]
MKDGYYLGIDVGSVSTNIVLMSQNGEIVKKAYLRTGGRPIAILTAGLKDFCKEVSDEEILGVGTTGSGRQLAAVICGADIVKNEITAHAVASQRVVPQVSTILEIGGQDSKIIFLKNGVVSDFAMNTVCAAGTGSFLDRQAERLGIPIEKFGSLALTAKSPTRIAGRCAVFAESDMIHKQQMGHRIEDIIAGLCTALVRNYLSNLARGKEITGPVMFQGGVAANAGIVAAFEEALSQKIIIPQYYDVMGAWGAAMLAQKKMEKSGEKTAFRGFANACAHYETNSRECGGCANNCEVIEITMGGKVVARWGDKCGKWSNLSASA